VHDQHPNYLILLKTLVPLHGYDPLNAWFDKRHRCDITSAGPTAHALLIYTQETKSQIEEGIRDLLGDPDDVRVVRIRDFEWPSATPDDETLCQWLENRADWKEWSAWY